jgi:DNA-binding NtrC family response regulator
MELVAKSEAMREAVRLASRVAATDAGVLVTGESGAGKDAQAAFIHARSRRAAGPYVKIDCGSLPGALLESELFGHEKGAFTGATSARPGRLEAAEGGTLVLDEIAHLSVDAQAKLLRVIERKEFERLGGRRTTRVDARVVALTNVDLEEAVARRDFRADLFYRHNVVRIHVPPLRERRGDIATLSRGLLKTYARKHGRRAAKLSAGARTLLEVYEWPGNVRELSHVLERAVIVADADEIGPNDLPDSVRLAADFARRKVRRLTLAEVEAEYIAETLKAARGNKSEAARLLGISRKSLYERLERQGNDEGGTMNDEREAVSGQ